MKKYFLILLLVLIACAVSIRIIAQLPVTKHLQWDANPATDNVTKYIMTVNGVATDVPTTLDTTCNCISAPITINQVGPLTLSVVAVNDFGSSTPSNLVVNVTIPGKSTNLRIK